MREQSAARDAVVGRIAARQHGVVATTQLRRAGISQDAIERGIRSGRLHVVHRGVYAVGHLALSREAVWMAAVLACCGRDGLEGRDSFLSHRSAAALWNILPPRVGPIDVAIVGEAGRRPRRGIRIHRPRTLEVEMTKWHSGIPLTSPARTIADLRRIASRRGGASRAEIRRATRQAAVLGLDLGAASRREPTRSELEHLFLQLCATHRLPTPEVNVDLGGLEVDFLWRQQRLVVETDGFRFHRGNDAFEEDRRRSLRLRALGLEVVRLSYRQVTEDALEVADTLRPRLLAAH